MMKKLLAAFGLGLVLLTSAALAQLGPFGVQFTTPVVVPGSLMYNGGTQVSAIRATGGTFTANGASAVTVTNANITANSVVVFGLKTQAGTPATAGPFMSATTPGTGFQVKSTAGDTSVYNYWILG
jgi:hypothetical protein